MPRLILLLAVAAIFYLLLKRISVMPPHRRRSEYMKVGIGAAVVLVIILTLAGKMHWVGAAITGLLVAARQSLPLLLRLFPLLGSLKSNAGGNTQQSTVSTAVLRMHLDHESGALSGDVVEGPFKDWRLDEMTREQLLSLREYCEEQDAESVQLLDGYLEQRFKDAQQQEHTGTQSHRNESGSNGSMSRQEALDVLALNEDADRQAIIDAHRKLMQKLHPDRGGSDYLAAKINQAKDFLLED
ncbi:MAG: molecular chaperone DnaJ [Congregibacter sp.]